MPKTRSEYGFKHMTKIQGERGEKKSISKTERERERGSKCHLYPDSDTGVAQRAGAPLPKRPASKQASKQAKERERNRQKDGEKERERE